MLIGYQQIIVFLTDFKTIDLIISVVRYIIHSLEIILIWDTLLIMITDLKQEAGDSAVRQASTTLEGTNEFNLQGNIEVKPIIQFDPPIRDEAGKKLFR